MQIVNLSRDGQVPIDGDFISITYPNGVKEEKQYWEPVAPEPAPSAPRILTHLQYMNRFTQAELRSIYALAKTVIDMEIWLDKFRQATHINLDEQELIDGLASLVAAGVLAANRPAEIRA